MNLCLDIAFAKTISGNPGIKQEVIIGPEKIFLKESGEEGIMRINCLNFVAWQKIAAAPVVLSQSFLPDPKKEGGPDAWPLFVG